MKIIEYKIITRGGTDSLEYAVNAAIRDGWIPHGNLVFRVETTTLTEYHYYMQPMVKEGDK